MRQCIAEGKQSTNWLIAGAIFEVLANATAMLNHGNLRLPAGLDRRLRWVLVTPKMHRVLHSVEDDETNSTPRPSPPG